MIYYVGYYNCEQINCEDRNVAPPAKNKMDYIISALTDATDEQIEVITPAETKICGLVKGRKLRINNRTTLKTFASFNNKNKLIRILGHLVTKISFATYLLIKIRPNDHLIVYHSLAYPHLIKVVRLLKKCKLTLEVEEIYADVSGNMNLRKKEINYLTTADNYIYITELLKNEISKEKKFIISHGTYGTIPDQGFRFDDDKIHVVYAGTFSQVRGGVFTAIAAAEHLDEGYILEILGNGSEEQIQAVKDKIQEVSRKTTCRINYVGYKSGNDFNAYVQACHIGLSTQELNAKFNDTSFPSKILMYMSNGLRVVSVRIPAVETSFVGKYMYYYDCQSSLEVAKAIRRVNFSDDYNSRKILNELNQKFCTDLIEIQ